MTQKKGRKRMRKKEVHFYLFMKILA